MRYYKQVSLAVELKHFVGAVKLYGPSVITWSHVRNIAKRHPVRIRHPWPQHIFILFLGAAVLGAAQLVPSSEAKPDRQVKQDFDPKYEWKTSKPGKEKKEKVTHVECKDNPEEICPANNEQAGWVTNEQGYTYQAGCHLMLSCRTVNGPNRKFKIILK